MFNPVSTYRIQFHKDFTFAHLEKILPYLIKLGISTIYASPIFKSVPGSNHGYDNVDPLTINPEIGTLDQLSKISKKLKRNGIGWLQDIVPNHMAFHHDNPWLMDLLKKGEKSAFKNYFDQSLADGSFFNGPIMVPFLGDDLDKVIANGELTIGLNNDKLAFKYADQLWPVNEFGVTTILKSFKHGGKDLKKLLKAKADQINSDKKLLAKIAGQQYYRLCNWKETDEQINYRRFFTVNGLICLNIQHQEVFNHVHQLTASLVKEGVFQGLRIDHIDGLFDPAQYLQRLRALTGDDTYIVVEKILEPGEELPSLWPIQGSTGYYFLSLVNNLFTNQESEKAFNAFYKDLVGKDKPVHRQIHDKKSLILTEHMNGELENLTNLFISSGLNEKAISKDELKEVISQLLIRFPVYRFYGNSLPLPAAEAEGLASILKKIKKNQPELTDAADLLEKVLVTNPQHGGKTADDAALYFYQRCMQLTGPLMAKGVEDTLMYTYNRFIDHNEVGDAPDAFGISVNDFHKVMQRRQQQWPMALNATATHDTKRGEGVRARLNVLSGISGEWLQKVREWQQLNEGIKQPAVPDANDEYFIYQTLAGAYPMPGQPEDDFKNRLSEYLEKMLREAKRHSTWAEPDEAYETGVKQFASAILDKSRPFWTSFEQFHQKISDLGVVNSLAQALLKLTCPGVPDVYQGTELWDLSLVDPDNRRPVDYKIRGKYLHHQDDISHLWENRFNGQIKEWLLNKALHLRKAHADLFSKGTYVPLTLKGLYADNFIAFARVHNGTWIITIAPLNVTQIPQRDGLYQWADTAIIIPDEAPAEFENTLTGVNDKHQKAIMLCEILQQLPFAVLKLSHPPHMRDSGVLMHITSLPSPYGIGDFGPQAKAFADILSKSRQHYWQVLPLNPTGKANAYSPYSAYSSHAGNILLISPETLRDEGLLTDDELSKHELKETGRVNFDAAVTIKNDLFDIAFNRFNKQGDTILRAPFDEFCNEQQFWLEDYALFSVIKQLNAGVPWYDWPKEYKFRDSEALIQFKNQHAGKIEKEKWLQYLFAKQWHSLKTYCNQLNIKLFGDLPFYIGYDSADVWTNPELFSLDENLELKSVCGVPPDYFNANGQRWGMPVFNWDKLKATGYDWWLKRIRKNLEWFDMLRLDHFRAFASYWEIPANEETAVNGKWEKGPGMEFFNLLQKEFPQLPFVAEDLGEIDQPVYDLRDHFSLPGMKVLQFAFGDDLPRSDYAPHHHSENFFVYTGTHDNNTTLGWFKQDADKTIKKNLNAYTGSTISKKNVNKILIKTAFASVCKTAIIPIQDWLELDEVSRMNTPAGDGENWTWQLTPKQMAAIPHKKIRKWTILYGRG